MCCVKFGFQFSSIVLFLAKISYFVCCNLIISKEIHKVVKYLGVRNRYFNMVSELSL
jgi:hypothetical protein